MQDNHLLEEHNEEQRIEVAYDLFAGGGGLFVDITGFIALVNSCYEKVDRKTKQKRIERLLNSKDWVELHKDKTTGKRILSETDVLEHAHEMNTVLALVQIGYDVIFAPKGMFERGQKRFDVYLLKTNVILEADLKSISSKSYVTIAQRIKEGCDQAPRLVLDIVSNIDKKVLIQGLRSGCYKNSLLKEIMLFYKGKFYRLPKDLIESKNIYGVIK